MRRRFPLALLVLFPLVVPSLFGSPAHSAPTDRAIVANSESVFGFTLFRLLAKDNPDANIVFSPFGIAQSLEVMSVASSGTTRAELLRVLRLPSSVTIARMVAASRVLRQELQELGNAENSNAPTVYASNVIVASDKVAYDQRFLDQVDKDFGQKLLGRDFTRAEVIRRDVNGVIESLTGRRLPTVFPTDSFTESTKLAVGGALTIEGNWAERALFQGDPMPFTRPDGSKVVARRLTTGASGMFLYRLDRPTYRSVMLPYTGGRLATIVVVPEPGQFAVVQKTFGAEELSDIVLFSRKQSTTADLPAFYIDNKIARLADFLIPMGLPTLFTRGAADLRGKFSTRPLAVDVAVHQSVFRMDTGGTAVDTKPSPPPGGPTSDLVVDRPFLFAVVDRPTGAVVLLGRVLDPNEQVPPTR